jgi:hypothetical protein
MALLFTRASSQYLRIPYNASMVVSTGTICAWVNPSSTATMQRVMSRVASASTATEVYGLDVYQSNCRLMVGKGVSNGLGGTTYSVDTVAGGSVPINTWTHIAGSWDGSNMRVYVNGAVVGTFARTAAVLTGTVPMSIGADYNNSTATEFFDGMMEDVRLYNRALSSNEIQTQYVTRGADCATFGLIINLGMYEGSRTTTLAASASVLDVGPFKFNATNIVAGPKFGDALARLRRSV